MKLQFDLCLVYYSYFFTVEGPAHARLLAAVDRFQRANGTALCGSVRPQGHRAVSDIVRAEQHRQHDRQRNVSLVL